MKVYERDDGKVVSECGAVTFISFFLLFVSVLGILVLLLFRLVLFLLLDLEQGGAQLGLSILLLTIHSRNRGQREAGRGRGQCGLREAFRMGNPSQRHL